MVRFYAVDVVSGGEGGGVGGVRLVRRERVHLGGVCRVGFFFFSWVFVGAVWLKNVDDFELQIALF